MCRPFQQPPCAAVFFKGADSTCDVKLAVSVEKGSSVGVIEKRFFLIVGFNHGVFMNTLVLVRSCMSPNCYIA